MGIDLGLRLGGVLFEHVLLGGLQHAIQPPQHGERQDDLAVVGLPVITRSRSATDQMKDDNA